MDSLSGALLNLENLSPGSVIDLETRSRHYRLEWLGGNEIRISGHPDFCPQPTIAQVQGSFNQQGSLEPGLIGPGMRVMLFLNGNRPMTTSPVLHLRVQRASALSIH